MNSDTFPIADAYRTPDLGQGFPLVSVIIRLISIPRVGMLILSPNFSVADLVEGFLTKQRVVN